MEMGSREAFGSGPSLGQLVGSNSLIIEKMAEYLPLYGLKECRLVNSTWEEATRHEFFNFKFAIVRISCRGQLSKFISTFDQSRNERTSEDSSDDIEQLRFRNFDFQSYVYKTPVLIMRSNEYFTKFQLQYAQHVRYLSLDFKWEEFHSVLRFISPFNKLRELRLIIGFWRDPDRVYARELQHELRKGIKGKKSMKSGPEPYVTLGQVEHLELQVWWKYGSRDEFRKMPEIIFKVFPNLKTIKTNGCTNTHKSAPFLWTYELYLDKMRMEMGQHIMPIPLHFTGLMHVNDGGWEKPKIKRYERLPFSHLRITISITTFERNEEIERLLEPLNYQRETLVELELDVTLKLCTYTHIGWGQEDTTKTKRITLTLPALPELRALKINLAEEYGVPDDQLSIEIDLDYQNKLPKLETLMLKGFKSSFYKSFLLDPEDLDWTKDPCLTLRRLHLEQVADKSKEEMSTIPQHLARSISETFPNLRWVHLSSDGGNGCEINWTKFKTTCSSSGSGTLGSGQFPSLCQLVGTNSVIIAKLVEYLPLDMLKECRLVNTTWEDASSLQFSRIYVVNIPSRGKLAEFISLFYQDQDQERSSAESSKEFERIQFQNFAFQSGFYMTPPLLLRLNESFKKFQLHFAKYVRSLYLDIKWEEIQNIIKFISEMDQLRELRLRIDWQAPYIKELQLQPKKELQISLGQVEHLEFDAYLTIGLSGPGMTSYTEMAEILLPAFPNLKTLKIGNHHWGFLEACRPHLNRMVHPIFVNYGGTVASQLRVQERHYFNIYCGIWGDQFLNFLGDEEFRERNRPKLEDFWDIRFAHLKIGLIVSNFPKEIERRLEPLVHHEDTLKELELVVELFPFPGKGDQETHIVLPSLPELKRLKIYLLLKCDGYNPLGNWRFFVDLEYEKKLPKLETLEFICSVKNPGGETFLGDEDLLMFRIHKCLFSEEALAKKSPRLTLRTLYLEKLARKLKLSGDKLMKMLWVEPNRNWGQYREEYLRTCQRALENI